MSDHVLRRFVAAALMILVAPPALGDPPVSPKNKVAQNRAEQRKTVRKAVAPNEANQDLVTEFKGKLKGFEQGVLIVTRDDGTDVMVQLPKDLPKLQFIATAKFEFLQPGMPVRFTGTFNQAGVAQSPIARVELFQPISGNLTGHYREMFSPGVYPDRNNAKEQAQTGIATCAVVGSLVGIDSSGLMMVRAGRMPVQIPLVQNATFHVRYNNLTLAQPGDEVSVAGFYNPSDDTKVLADVMTITTDRVYGEPVAEEPKKKRTPRPKRDRAKKPSDQATDDESTAVNATEDKATEGDDQEAIAEPSENR